MISYDNEGDPTKSINLFNRLIDEGFLNIEYPVSSGSKNWIEELLSFILKNTQLSKKYTKLILLLENIQTVILNLEKTFSVNERARYIEESHEQILKYFYSLDNETSFLKKVKPQDLFYEDTFSKSEDIVSFKTFSDVSINLKKAFFL